MSRGALEVAGRFFEPIFGGDADIVEAVEDDEAWFESGKLMDATAPIRFITGGGAEMAAGPFRGAAGCRQGWREWVAPWEHFRMIIEEVRVVDAETILVLVRTIGLLPGSDKQVVEDAAAVMKVEEGRIVAMDHYLDREMAIREAGSGS